MCGIYRIVNLVNNHCYVGSTNNFHIRKRAHYNLLRRGKHFNPKLQFAYNKYGEENLVFETMITCPLELLFWYEQQFLDKWKPEYNISKYAEVPTMRGDKLDPDHIKKISKSLMGKKRSEESIKRQSVSRTGIKYSEEGKRKLSESKMKNPTRTKSYITSLVSPDGIVYKEIHNMKKFCREHGIGDTSHIYDVIHGKRNMCSGWTLLQEGV